MIILIMIMIIIITIIMMRRNLPFFPWSNFVTLFLLPDANARRRLVRNVI